MNKKDRILVKATKVRLNDHPSVKIMSLVKIIERLDAENKRLEAETDKVVYALVKS